MSNAIRFESMAELQSWASRKLATTKAIPWLTESEEQEALINWVLKIGIRKYPELDGGIYHVPNGGFRTKSEAARFSRLGVLPGIPDLHVPISRRTYHSLYLEMKAKNGTISQAQLCQAQRLALQGNVVAFCFGWEMARDTLCWYMEQK